MATHTQVIERETQVARLKVEILGSVSELDAIDPSESKLFVAKLAGIFGVSGTSQPRRTEGGSSTTDKVIAHFVSIHNKTLTKPELVEATGLTDGQIHNALYGQDAKATFSIEAHPGGGRFRGIRLTEAVYKQAVAEEGERFK